MATVLWVGHLFFLCFIDSMKQQEQPGKNNINTQLTSNECSSCSSLSNLRAVVEIMPVEEIRGFN